MIGISPRFYILLLINLLVVACDTSQTQKSDEATLQLIPLSPYQYEFDGEFGKSRIDYYYVSSNIRDVPNLAQTLLQLVKSKEISEFSNYSIYVYDKTSVLNDSFKSTAQELKSLYKANLLSYARWNNKMMDVFYIVKSGNAVFDILQNKAITYECEFE